MGGAIRDFISNLLNIKNKNPPPGRVSKKPISPSLNIPSVSPKKLKKALILGFTVYNFLATGDALINEAKAVEQFIRQIAPTCEIHTIYEKKYDIYNQSTNNDITIENVIQELQWLSQNITSDDHIFFYYAGHGTRRPDSHTFPHEFSKTDPLLSQIDIDYVKHQLHDTLGDWQGTPVISETIEVLGGWQAILKGWKFKSPPNRFKDDEPQREYYDKNGPPGSQIQQLTKSDFCIVIPELVWVDQVTYAEYIEHSVNSEEFAYTWVASETIIEKTGPVPINSLSSQQKLKYGNLREKWELLPDSYILMRDDDLYHYIIDPLPAGAKALICSGACESGPICNPKYEWNLISRGPNSDRIFNELDTGDTSDFDKHLVGIKQNIMATRVETDANVLIIAASRTHEEATLYSSDEISIFLHTLLSNCEAQWADNIQRNKSNKTALNLKLLYGDLCNKVYDSLPQIAAGKNIFPQNNDGTTLRSFDSNNNITIGAYTIHIGENNIITVNNYEIHDSNIKIYINGLPVYYIQNTNNKTLVIGDNDYDIIPSGSNYLIDIPIMFDFF